jgi:hypothetical protein
MELSIIPWQVFIETLHKQQSARWKFGCAVGYLAMKA